MIKVEAPGDVFGYGAPSAHSKAMGYIALNRGKQSLVLDLKQEADRAILHDLLADADIFIHNVRAEAIERLGFDYDSVRALAPTSSMACVGFGWAALCRAAGL